MNDAPRKASHLARASAAGPGPSTAGGPELGRIGMAEAQGCAHRFGASFLLTAPAAVSVARGSQANPVDNEGTKVDNEGDWGWLDARDWAMVAAAAGQLRGRAERAMD